MGPKDSIPNEIPQKEANLGISVGNNHMELLVTQKYVALN